MDLLITTVAAVIVAVWVALLTARAAGRGGRRGGWLDSRVRREVAVHLVDSSSLRGVLWDVLPDAVVLRHARVLDAAGDRDIPADGDVVIPRAQVSWVQVLPGEVTP